MHGQLCPHTKRLLVKTDKYSCDDSTRKRFVRGLLCLIPISFANVLPRSKAIATALPMPTLTKADTSLGLSSISPANPFFQLETVGMVPKSYFEDHVSVYGFVERILDGDTIRVRHVPGYSFTNKVPEPLAKRGIADDTLLIRLFGVDCPEIAKSKTQTTQPFAEEAKQFTTDLVFHKMVKVTFLRRDRYGRAISMVESVPDGAFLRMDRKIAQDLSIELAREGLAELYEGGGAEYFTKKDELVAVVSEAEVAHRGIWSLGDDRISAAEQKRTIRKNISPTRL